MQGDEKKISRSDLAQTIFEIYEEFGPGNTKIKKSKAFKIVGVITQSIKEALQKGDKVRVDGFGSFKLYTEKEHKCSITLIPEGTKATAQFLSKAPRSTITIPKKQVVKFRPSKTLLNLLNQEN